jgi:hypothetical protein
MRRVLRAIYRCLGVTAVSLVFQACYGMPPDTGEVSIYGSVKSKKTDEFIPGIKVSAADNDYYNFTDSNGAFNMLLLRQDSYAVIFEDVDGPQNGGLFKQHTINISRLDENYAYLNVELEEDTEE